MAAGVTDVGGLSLDIGDRDPGAMLSYIDGRGSGRERAVWIMRDLGVWLADPIGMQTRRQVRNLARKLPGLPRSGAQAIIVLSTSGDVPPDLAGHATVLDWPMPDRAEIALILDSAVESLPDEYRDSALPARDAAIDAALGLSGEEAAATFARSLVQSRRIDPATVSREKRRVIARERILDWYDPLPGGLAAVGGLDNLKFWLATAERRLACRDSRLRQEPNRKSDCNRVGSPVAASGPWSVEI